MSKLFLVRYEFPVAKQNRSPSLDFDQIRRLTITALFSDDLLFDQIVPKGGNAMTLVHGISSRTSLDLDFSLETDFSDVEEIRTRAEQALAGRFVPLGLVPFDVKLAPKPAAAKESRSPRWGGYRLEFKVVDDDRYQRLKEDLERLRREAMVTGPNQLKVFSVDFSKWEYTVTATAGKTRTELDSYTIYVYSPQMIALEKVRAICQQMEEYTLSRTTRAPRARDFYDIHTVVTKTGFRFDSAESTELLKAIFAAKEVPLPLMGKISEQREFHRTDWPSVQAIFKQPRWGLLKSSTSTSISRLSSSSRYIPFGWNSCQRPLNSVSRIPCAR
ncbi:MAG: nucleotidyl transferase AbiEii/AbiGii toxin family protein [Bryobacteraceae bacterium]